MATLVMQRHVSDVLADFVCGVRAADIPAPVMVKAKAHLLHMLASAVAGRGTELGDQAVRVARALTSGQGVATIVAERERAGITEAAFANGALMMALSRDDVLLSAG